MIRRSLALALAMALPAAAATLATVSADAAPLPRPGFAVDRLNGEIRANSRGGKVAIQLTDASFRNLPGQQQYLFRGEVIVNGRHLRSAARPVRTNAGTWTVWPNAGNFMVDVTRAAAVARGVSRAQACVLVQHPATRLIVGKECTTFALVGLPAKPPAPTAAVVKEALEAKDVKPEDLKTVAAVEAKSGPIEAVLQAQVEAALEEKKAELTKDATAEIGAKVEAEAKAEGEKAAAETATEVQTVATNAAAENKAVQAATPAKRGFFSKIKKFVKKGVSAAKKLVSKNLSKVASKVVSKAQSWVSGLAKKATTKWLPGIQSRIEKTLKLRPGALNFARNKLSSFINKKVAVVNTTIANTVTKRVLPAVRRRIGQLAAAKLPKEAAAVVQEATAEEPAEAPADGADAEAEVEIEG